MCATQLPSNPITLKNRHLKGRIHNSRRTDPWHVEERTTGMKPKQRKTRMDPSGDVIMTDISEAKPQPRPRRAKKSSGDKKTRFKEEQHLKIETQDLQEPDAEKAAPPSITSKKRRRRSAAEIDRKFKCSVEDCPKAYGSEGSLIHHQKIKHPELAEAEALEKKEAQAQAGTFSLPLHNAFRNVTIRPATPLVKFTSHPKLLIGNQSTNDLSGLVSPTDIIPPSAKAPRRNMRSRSNSEPVTAPIPVKPRAKTPRKPRRVPTPHPKKITVAAATARRNKLRSKSESLPEMAPFQPLEELKMPINQRSDSVASAHEAILPISNTNSGGLGSFQWSPASISESGHHSTSLSSDEQAIDSDILSVLANCDADEIGDPEVLDFGGGPPPTSSFQSNSSFGKSDDTEMLPVGMECFKISENATLPTEEARMKEPESELGLNAFATLGDDWANALHLSNHLEKMSMAQVDSPPHSLESAFGGLSERPMRVGRLRSASDPVHVAAPMHPDLTHFSSMPLEPFVGKSEMSTDQFGLSTGMTNFPHWLGNSSTELTKVEGSSLHPTFWLSSGADVATMENLLPTSAALDELLQHDDTLEWKAANGFEGEAEADYALGDAGVPSLL
ncbi:hypothetical protein V7S43_014577 [Phytophthora oleae]|uniref:C2H2-type domain-containing protein n=1 Tax=Phytophthora oleae TaxID=2107226 RepID=A0ABD3F5U1_9STRA